MGIRFIFFIFGLSVRAKEEDLQGYPSMQNDSTTFKTTTPNEEQNSSAHDDGKASTERPAHLTTAVISSPMTDFLDTAHEKLQSRRVNVITANDTDAITQNIASSVLMHSTDSLILSKDSTANKQLQSKGDLLLISNDKGVVHPSAETEFEWMMNDTMMPSAHLSKGREKIFAFFYASLKSKNQTVLDSITFSPANGIPLVSASDPAVIDNLGESNESEESQGKNRNKNWILELFRTGRSQKPTIPIQAEEASLNKTHPAIIRFTVSQNTKLLTAMNATDFKNSQYPKKEFEQEQNHLHSQNSAILDMPLQVKSTSPVAVDQMTESSRNPSADGPKLNGPDEKHTDTMFLFSTSKLTPTKATDSTAVNYSSNTVTAAGEMHVTKQLASSQLISDSFLKIVSASNALESKLIFHSESSKMHHIKQTSTTSFLHRLNKSDVQSHNEILSAAQNSSSSDLHSFKKPVSIQARTCNMSKIKIRNRIDHSLVLLSKLITASFTSAEEASTTSDTRSGIKDTHASSFTALPNLSPQEADTRLSRESPLKKPLNAFHVFKVNNYSLIRQSPTHFPSETLRLSASNPPDGRPARATREPSERTSTQSLFTSANVKRFRNNQNYSANRNGKSSNVSFLISERLNVTTVSTTTPYFTSFFTVPLPRTPNSNVSTTSITFARTPETLITPLSLKPQVSVVDRLLSSHAVSQKKTSLISTSFSKTQNIVTTDGTILSKLSGISAKSNNKNIFLDHSSTTENIGSPLGDRHQGPKNPKGTEMLFSTRYTVSSIPSVRHYSGETSLTATQRLQSKVQIESYLKKRDGTVKPTTLQHSDHSSVVGMNHTSLKSILDKVVSLSQTLMPINSTSVPSVVYSTSEFKHRLAFSALPETLASAKRGMTLSSISRFNFKPITSALSSGKDNHKDSSHQVLENSTDVQEHPQKMASRQISGITGSLNKDKINTTTAILNMSTSSPIESSIRTISSAFLQMPSVSHKKHTTLSKNQTEVFTTVNRLSQMTQPNVPSYEMSSSDTPEDQNPLELTAKSYIYSEDVGTQTFPKGSLKSSGGRVDVSHGANPYAQNESEESTELMPVINRRKMIISSDSLTGSEQISDDICGTGNYTAEMSLKLERDIMPGDLIPAFGNLRVVINLKTNNSHVDLEIKSCCLSPTVRLDEFNTTCCIFSQLAVDPHGSRLLPSVPSNRATFTIRLFQMINYSSAYLHCDLSVCLRNHSECERQCVERRNARPVEEAGAMFSNVANRISFGPVLKGSGNSSYFEAAADTEAAVVIMSSAAGCLLACLALLFVWMALRRCLERSACCRSEALCECQQRKRSQQTSHPHKIYNEHLIII